MDEKARHALWERYSIEKSAPIKEQLILEYAQLVKYVAGRLSMYLGGNVEFDDLTGYGIFGLIDAIDKFDYKKGIKFETYASLRIRGAILDNIRKMDWIPRSIRKKQKMMEAASNKIENQYGIDATDEMIARELNITMDEYYKWTEQTSVLGISSLEELTDQVGDISSEGLEQGRFDEPEAALEKEELKTMLVEAISELTEKERRVITLYYYEDLTLKEISLIMEVSESRISQLHTKSIKKMRVKLGDYIGVLTKVN